MLGITGIKYSAGGPAISGIEVAFLTGHRSSGDGKYPPWLREHAGPSRNAEERESQHDERHACIAERRLRDQKRLPADPVERIEQRLPNVARQKACIDHRLVVRERTPGYIDLVRF